MTDRDRAWGRLKAHRHYAYRACAPHWDNPTVCAADEAVTTAVFFAVDQEPQKVRLHREATAKRLCAGCPIVDACREYAIGDGTTVREPHQIWGGTTPSERKEILARRIEEAEAAGGERQPVLARIDTQQKRDVLAAVVMHDDLGKVMAETGLDDRTVLWQIARLYTLLRVPRDQRTWQALREAAWDAGLLPRPEPAAADTAATAEETQEQETQPATLRLRVRAPRRDRFRHIPGQEEIALFPGADVIHLPAPRTARVLEGVAA